jgi:hypothetical protein
VPAALRYDPVTNPTGARPTMFDWVRNIYGRDPVTGFGLRPYDNVECQVRPWRVELWSHHPDPVSST